MFYNFFEGPPSLVFEHGATGYPWVRGSQKIPISNYFNKKWGKFINESLSRHLNT